MPYLPASSSTMGFGLGWMMADLFRTAELAKLAHLGRSLWKRRKEILAYFDTGASNGPVEAIRLSPAEWCTTSRPEIVGVSLPE